MNKSVLITGANAGLGKETARQLALLKETERVILACRNPTKAQTAKQELEKSTGKNIFEILIMDVSNADSVKAAVASMAEPVDAIIMNAGGMGGKTPGNLTPSGMNEISATNLLGHVVLVDELLKADKLKKSAVYVSTEAARGIKKMGMERPKLKTNSVGEMEAILDGSFFGEKLDGMKAYGYVKYVGTLWISSMSRKFPNIKFVSVSPGATSGTEVADNVPTMVKIMFKYLMMPIILPLRGMVHKVDKGAARFVNALNNDQFQTGGFYASEESKVTGQVVDQFKIFPTMANKAYQDNAYAALHEFVR
ncbi:MAG: SDR family NAD(P)-dependent oxidoreductase [Crocinitomicaceae bacterium]|nr:SDR family NAD(P)-dependent oxidoreductase [Crocinitomicaceae bacterium]